MNNPTRFGGLVSSIFLSYIGYIAHSGNIIASSPKIINHLCQKSYGTKEASSTFEYLIFNTAVDHNCSLINQKMGGCNV